MLRVGYRVKQFGPLDAVALEADGVVGVFEFSCFADELLPEFFKLIEFDGGVLDLL